MKPNLKRAALIAIVVLILLGLAHTALAASNCAPRADMEQVLIDKYGESPTVSGKMSKDVDMTIWSNSLTGTWTALVLTPSGQACIVASGREFKDRSGPNI